MVQKWNASARNWTVFSLESESPDNAPSTETLPGPLRLLRPRLPYDPSAGLKMPPR